MSLFDGMKDKLGFGNKPEWQDDDYQDDNSDGYGYDDKDGYDDGYDNGGYADEDYEDDGYSDGSGSSSSHSHSVVSFDAYNPSNFDNVKISSERSPRVASYDDLGKSRYSGSSTRSTGNVRPLGSRSGSSRSYGSESGSSSPTTKLSSGSSGSNSGAAGGTWTPSDPSFLDNQGPSYGSRDVMDEIHAADPYSSLGSDFLNASKDPATHLEVVRPTAYADVEKIATAAKAGKSVILVVSETKPALAKRILDFSFGVASALNMNVDKAADRVFVLSRGAEMLSEEERKYLTDEGILK